MEDLKVGTLVVAREHLDPEGADVREGTPGVVFADANVYGDGGGPMVAWDNGGVCNVYDGDIDVIEDERIPVLTEAMRHSGRLYTLELKIHKDWRVLRVHRLQQDAVTHRDVVRRRMPYREWRVLRFKAGDVVEDQ